MVVQQKTLACKLLVVVLVAWFWINTILLTTRTTTTSRSSMVLLSFVVSPPSYITKVLGGFVVFVDAVGSSSTKKLFDVRQSSSSSSSSSLSSSWLNKVGNNNNISGKRRSKNSIRNRTTTVTANTSIVRRGTSKFCFVPSSFNLNNERLILHRSSSSSTTQFHSRTQTTTLLQAFLPSIIRKSRSRSGSTNNRIMIASLGTSSSDVLHTREDLDGGSTDDNGAKRYLVQHHQGNWAGQVSKFSSLDGSVIPVPEHLVPESMVEWGQIPPQLEQFTTDVFETIEEGDDSDSRVKLERTTIQVLPEVGCGIDNLETTKSKQIVDDMTIQWLNINEKPIVRMVLPSTKDNVSPPLCFMVPQQQEEEEQQQRDATDKAILNNTPPSSFVMILPKKTFGQTKQIYITHVYFVSSANEKQQQQRMRIMLDVEVSDQNDESSPCIKLVSPIEVVLERQTSPMPSTEGGYVGDGGGLDARTVAQLVGVNNINKPFATWDDLVAAATKDEDNADDITRRAHRRTIQIPCGVTISVNDHKGILQVAVSERMFHKHNEKDDNEDELAQNINTQSVSIQFC